MLIVCAAYVADTLILSSVIKWVLAAGVRLITPSVYLVAGKIRCIPSASIHGAILRAMDYLCSRILILSLRSSLLRK